MKTQRIRLIVGFVSLALIALAICSYSTSTRAQADEPPSADKTLSPYFFVQGDPAVDHLPLKDTKVDVSISGVIADVKVVQTYRNEGTRPINATYVFPASTRAAVYAMQMRIGDDLIIARIKEREAAKQEFETAKKEGKSASLLEQSRPNVFTMNLANLMPQEQVDIELHYTELLVPTDGVYELVYPTGLGHATRLNRNQTRLTRINSLRVLTFMKATSPRASFTSTRKFRPACQSRNWLAPRTRFLRSGSMPQPHKSRSTTPIRSRAIGISSCGID
jgi:Vault protein inter-alpha-trypsin domain